MTSAAVNIGFLEGQAISRRRVDSHSSPLPRKHILAALCLFASLAAQLWVRVSYIEAGYKLEELRSIALKNDSAVRDQRVEYALMVQPEQLARYAEERLGMKKITPQQIRKID